MTNYLFWGPLAAIISGLLYLLLKLTLEKTITTRIDYIKEKEIENLKASFTKELESARHQYQLQQVRTPLFFDHQRQAFSEILSALVDITDAFAKSYDPSTDEHNPISGNAHENLRQAYHRNLLFLDEDCCIGVDLCLRSLLNTHPLADGDGVHYPPPESFQQAFEEISYFRKKLTKLFQSKLGLADGKELMKDIVIAGSVLLLNRYHFAELGLPIKGKFARNNFASMEACVATGAECQSELIDHLHRLIRYLAEDRTTGDVFAHVKISATNYVRILTN